MPEVTHKRDDARRILLVDPSPILRLGITRLVEPLYDLTVGAEVADGEEACRLATRQAFDLILMDMDLPGISGVETATRLCRRLRSPRILVHGRLRSPVAIESALKAGALGFLPTSSALSDVLAALREVALGRIYLSPEDAQSLALYKTSADERPFESLTPREFEICQMLVQGRAHHDIAARLSLSYKTVSNHITRIKRKLKATTLAQLSWLASHHRMI